MEDKGYFDHYLYDNDNSKDELESALDFAKKELTLIRTLHKNIQRKPRTNYYEKWTQFAMQLYKYKVQMIEKELMIMAKEL